MPETITSTVSTPTGLGGGLGRGLQSPPEMMGWMQPPPMFGQGSPSFILSVRLQFSVIVHVYDAVYIRTSIHAYMLYVQKY